MRACLFILLLAALWGCNNNAGTTSTEKKDSIPPTIQKDYSAGYIHNFEDTALESKITAALMKLPFVQKSNAYIDSFSNHRHGMAFMLDSSDNKNEISVQAGYNGEERFETYYHFYVDPKTMEITVYDMVNDKRMSVKDYIKSQQQK
jgi:hypothetical protein